MITSPLHIFRTASHHLDEARRLLGLALPAMLTGVGFVAMGTVDTLIVGSLGPAALAGVALANSVWFSLRCLSLGFLDAVTPLIARRHGAGDADGVARVLWNAFALAALSGSLLAVLALAGCALLPHLVEDPEVVRLGVTYLGIRALGAPFQGVGMVCNNYLYGVGETATVTRVVLAANVFNAAADAALVFGVPVLGLPPLGVAGAAIATVLANVVISTSLASRLVAAARRGVDLAPRALEGPRAREIVRIGWPIGLHYFLETSIFSVVAVLAARVGAVALSAHHIGMSLASLAFVLVNGFANAASIRVGHHLGAGDAGRARHAAGVALVLSLLPMGVMSTGFLAFPEALARAYSSDEAVVRLATELLAIAVAFHVADGLQAVAAGCLRGTGDTRSALVANLVGYWAIGVPAGLGLAFHHGLGIRGLWWGLTLALGAVAIVLGGRFLRKDLATLKAQV